MLVLVRGGGDIGSGVALHLYRAGLRVVIAELPQPLALRRLVCFAEAVYTGETTVEGVIAHRVKDPLDTLRVLNVLSKQQIPVLIDPQAESIRVLHPTVVVDARMFKQHVELNREPVNLLIGLGPGFVAGENCHAVVETNRGFYMGRVIWQGAPEDDTGVPEAVGKFQIERILRSPADGILQTHVEIGAILNPGDLIAEVAGQPVTAGFRGVVRGLLRQEMAVTVGMKIGDLDPRADPRLCSLISDKSLSVGGGVLEAILSRPNLRPLLWT